MSDPISPLARNTPPAVSEEPIQSEMPPAGPLVCGPSSGAEGAGGAGSDALVRRFSDSNGAGGNPGFADATPAHERWCGDEALTAVGACGGALVLAVSTGGVAALFGGVVCAGALGTFAECVEQENAAARR
ncbi:MAG TPA: hypothetical protein VF103_06150 [Polyangiaceae bacterium]